MISSPWITYLVTVGSTALAAGCVCAAILWLLLRTGLAWRLATDVPNQRSLHERPTPRVGGWGIVPAVVVVMVLTAPRFAVIPLCALALAAMSQVDDRRGLSARVRFMAHFAAAAVLLATMRPASPWWVLIPLAFALVWLINLYNFMDGSDGLAGGMALFGFGGYALAALIGQHPDPALACACAAVAGAAAGFLVFNFHPARIFLGDAGSIPLGFLAGALGYWGWREGTWPFWFPAMAFSPFIADATVTLLRRLARGEKFWQAHREHYYQRMVRLGMGHARTALCWYALMVAGIVLACLALGQSFGVQLGLAVVWAIALLTAGVAIDIRWRRSEAFLSSSTSREV
ncbi:MraY family glycosyltransferase [Trinickia acidisoli]|uniref:MraY family glycosyltransferase n=1 Tax=Trinickia acidisoli TaxID=2767482 RepID=UPI001A8D1DD8|nr:glycosyltransferase family 4 protein [Trinickia acidisoli]